MSAGWQRATRSASRAAQRIARAVARNRRLADRDGWQPVADRAATLADAVADAARYGHELEREVAHLDPDVLAARLATFSEQAASEPSAELASAITAVHRDVESRQQLLGRVGTVRLRLDRATTRLDDVARRLDDGYGTGRPADVAAELARLADDLAAFRASGQRAP